MRKSDPVWLYLGWGSIVLAILLIVLSVPVSAVESRSPQVMAKGGGPPNPIHGDRDWVWEDTPNLSGNLYSSEVMSGYGFETETANDFYWPGGTLMQVDWWGGCWNGDGCPFQAFNLIIYEDWGGYPGYAYWRSDYVYPSIEYVGEGVAGPVYRYSAYVYASLYGGRFWFTAQASDHSFPPQWGRLGAVGVTDYESMFRSAYFSYPDWIQGSAVFGEYMDVSQAFYGEPPPPPDGACCFPDGHCEIRLEEDCYYSGGVWQGPYTACVPNPCIPTVACCFGDGHCESLIADECTIQGGSSMGEGSVCDPNPCPCPFEAVAYDWNFASGDHGFHRQICDPGGTAAWEYGETTLIPAPVRVWGTVLEGNYPDGAGDGLFSPSFLVTPETRMMEVTHYMDIVNGDGCNVKVNGQVIEPGGGYGAGLKKAHATLLSQASRKLGLAKKTDVSAKHGEGVNGGPARQGIRGGGETVETAVPISALPYVDSGYTCGHSNDYEGTCGGTGGPDVVYSYIPPGDENVRIDLCASTDYDSKIYVFQDVANNVIACNDDLCGLQSALDVWFPAGHIYYIVIDGYSSSCGNYAMSVTSYLPCVVECPAGALQENEPPCQEGYVDNYNAGCNVSPPVFQWISPQVGGCAVMCGKSCMTSAAYDYDWYEVEASGDLITATLTPEKTMDIYLVEMYPDCGFGAIVYASTTNCEPATIALPSVPGGTYGIVLIGYEGPEFDYVLDVCGIGAPVPAYCVEGEPQWTGSRTWSKSCFDLSAFMGTEVTVEFDFGSDGSSTAPGMYISRVRVGEPGAVPGACCAVDGSCTILTPLDCDAAGGEWQGVGTYCDPNPCPLPPVACCYSDGHCEVQDPVICQAMGGIPREPGSTCDPDPCSTGHALGGWGLDDSGQCDVPPGSYFTSLSAGARHGLGLTIGGSVLAWGESDYGQCEVPLPNSGFTAVAAGYYHSLALRSDGSIAAWGANWSGQCDVPLPNSGFIAIDGGYGFSVGLKADGSVVAWGANDWGQLDIPSPNADFVAIETGGYHCLGLKRDGSIVAWGYNDYGQCDVPAPNSDFVAVGGGGYCHSLAVKEDGTVVAWGCNDNGQCDVPARSGRFTAVSAGHYHSLGLRTDGSVAAWGLNDYGQCDVPAPNVGYLGISGGGYHSLALRIENEAGTEEPSALPTAFLLGNARPNPFNPKTTIVYELPNPSSVRLMIYDVGGRAVRTLVDENRPAGRFTAEWDGRDDTGRLVSGGIYFYSMKAGAYQSNRRMTLIK